MTIDRGTRVELLDGELHIYRPGLDPEHHATAQEIALALFRWSEDSQYGRSVPAPGVLFGPYDEVAPDTMWISDARFRGALDEDGHLTVAPELMVEVVSPDEADQRRVYDLKLRSYAQQSVEEYWIVDYAQRHVQTFRRAGRELLLDATLKDDDALTSRLLPGFTMTVADLWADERTIALIAGLSRMRWRAPRS